MGRKLALSEDMDYNMMNFPNYPDLERVPKTFMKNKEYKFFSKNCGQVVVDLFSLGTLPDGTNAGGFAYPNGYGQNALLPNLHMANLQSVFLNKATNIKGFNEAIEKAQKKYEGKNGFIQWWYSDLKNRVDTIK